MTIDTEENYIKEVERVANEFVISSSMAVDLLNVVGFSHLMTKEVAEYVKARHSDALALQGAVSQRDSPAILAHLLKLKVGLEEAIKEYGKEPPLAGAERVERAHRVRQGITKGFFYARSNRRYHS